MPPRHRSLRFGALQVVILASLLGGGGLVWHSWTQARALIGREESAFAIVRRLADAEAALRKAGRVDRDADGTPEFGSLEDLVRAGLIPYGLATDEEGTHIESPGYRVEILLPTGVDPGGRRRLGRSTSAPDPKLAATTFAAVAMPSRDGHRTLRAFYLDADGRYYVAEGVYDPDRNPAALPPRLELRDPHEEGADDDGPLWRPSPLPPASVARGS